MPILHMNTDSVRNIGNSLTQFANSLNQQKQQLSNKVQTLATEWDGPSADMFDSQAQDLLRNIGHQGESISNLAQRLDREVAQWEAVATQLGGGSITSAPPSASTMPTDGAAKENISAKQTPPTYNEGGSTSAPSSPQPTPSPHIPNYDGQTPAEGTYGMSVGHPTTPPLTSTPDARSGELYTEVIDQFAVGNNPRYAQNEQRTYCNIFAWDVTKAMGAEIPHWVDANGNSVAPATPGSQELRVNGMVEWLETHGERNGWHPISAEEAQARANEGKPAVALWRNPNPGQPGHVGIVRPGEYDTDKGPAIAQAGMQNFNHGHVTDGFGNLPVVYYVHD